MAEGKVYIGTSGWHYKDWRGIYYPEKLKTADWLPYYAKEFNTTEINNSFYRLPSRETVEAWTDKVPAGFKFCPKFSRYLTHFKKLREPEEPLQRFFSVFDAMKKKLGPVLLQLPKMVAFQKDIAEHLFQLLKREYGAHKFAIEGRHDSWMSQESIRLMERYQIAFTISQSGVGWPYAEHLTAKHVYMRFHGPGKLYASRYSDEMLKSFARKFRRWRRDGHDLWIYFNNDWYAHAIDNARTLMKLLE